MNLRKLVKIEKETLEELQQAVSDAAEQVASLLSSTSSRQYAAQVIQDAAERLQDELTIIIVRARDASAALAYDEVRIEARALDIDEPEEPEDDPDDDARGLSVAGAFVAAWMLALLLAGKRDVKRVSALQEYRLRRIAATEVPQSYNAAALRMYENIKAVPSLRKRWDSTLDARVCKYCRNHDGEEVPLDEDFSYGDIPGEIHPNCRCVTTLVSTK